MREEAYGAKPMAEAIQAMLLEHLNMRTELEVLEARTFLDRLWKQDLQLVWIRWLMDYPDPHNEYFDPFYSKRPTGKRQAWTNGEFDRLLETARGERETRRRGELYRQAEEVLQRDVGYVPVTWVVRYAAVKPWVKGIETNRSGERVVDGNIYVDMLSHLHITERAPT
jgi:ABC-type transport system substrate-binding protein